MTQPRLAQPNRAVRSGGRHRAARRGSAYLVVLGVSLIVAALAYGGILATRARGRIAVEVSDASEARRYARDSIQIGRLWIQQDSNWRSNRPTSAWATNVAIGGGTYTLEAIDPADGNLADFPHDSLVLKATAQKGKARQLLQTTLTAKPVPLPALQYAIHTGGVFQVKSGKTLHASGATVSTNGTLNNSGTINSNVSALLVLSLFGTINGTTSLVSLPKALPSDTVVNNYAALGTQISASTLDKHVLGPGANPFGAPNANGIYVVRPTGDFTIKNSRVFGTLVVVCPAGKKVIVDNNVLLHPYRSDCPSLIVQGDADLIFLGGDNLLREADHGVSFNPNGAPYNGITNGTKSETFPSEIQGLVHVTGKVLFKQSPRIRGAVLACATGSNTVVVDGTPTIVYTPGLTLNPPSWYTTSVTMPVERGSWRQVAN